MNEYEYRIPLLGPYYSNSRIVRIIRTNSVLNLFILFSALLEGKPQKNSYCSNKISGDAITWLPKLQVRFNNYFPAILRLNAGHTFHPAKIPAPLASSGSSQMLNSAPEWGPAVSLTHGEKVILKYYSIVTF